MSVHISNCLLNVLSCFPQFVIHTRNPLLIRRFPSVAVSPRQLLVAELGCVPSTPPPLDLLSVSLRPLYL